MAFAQKTDNASGPKPGDDASIEPVHKLLTLSNIELSAFVEAEIEKNPVLEAAPSQPLTDRTGQSDHPTVETIGELTNQTELEPVQNRSVKIWEQVWKTYIQTSRITDHRQQTTRRPKKNMTVEFPLVPSTEQRRIGPRPDCCRLHSSPGDSAGYSYGSVGH